MVDFPSPRLEALLRRNPLVVQDLDIVRSSAGFEKSLYLEDSWKSLRDRGQARRSTIDPLELGASILPHIVILDVLDAGEDFHWRLFGGAHADEYGINLSGMTLSDLRKRNPVIEEVELIFRHCTETRGPTYYRIDYENDRGCSRSCCGVILPLFETDDRVVTHLLGCSEWVDR